GVIAMYRAYVFAIVFFATVPNELYAQAVVVVKQPGAGQWTVSYSRVSDQGDSTTGSELSGSFKTLAAAQQEAARLQNWSRSMDGGSSWRLRTIYIEGEDANGAPQQTLSPKTPSLFTALEQKLERDKITQDALKDLGVGKTSTGKFASDMLTNPSDALTKE